MNSREIVERILAAGLARDYDTFVALMAPDGYVEWPYHPSGSPVRIEGQEAIRAFLGAAERAPIRITAHRDLVIHETTDPAVVIVEYQAVGTLTTTGAPFEQTLIAVFTVHNGRIVSYRDYLDPMKVAAALSPS